MDQKFFESIEALNTFFQEEEIDESSMIQTLIFDKEVFETQAEAIEWAMDHCFSADKVDETDDSFRIRQLEPSEFIADSFRTIELRRGIKAVIGRIRMNEMIDPFVFKVHKTDNIKLSSEFPSVIEIAKVVNGVHPAYGPVIITKEMLKQFHKNFNANVVGVDLSIDFDHETREAAGWIKSVFLNFEEDTLLAEVRWTPKGALSLSDREFRYYSPEFTLNYVHPHTGVEHGPTLLGGALVNRPFLKMDAIVGLKTTKGDKPMETIALKEHEAKVAELKTEITSLKELSEKASKTVEGLKSENVKLSDELKALKEANEKAEKEAKHKRLFDEGKINAAQLKALNEGQDMMDVLSLGGKMNTKADGSSEADNNDLVQLSEKEKEFCKKTGITEEDYLKFNKGA